jgi:antitoxin (DNA-binding transcriptional repressor) of toxin-antitoxin stability system
MPKTGSITIKQLHAKTGEEVRRAGRSRNPVVITDRGRVVALLVAPQLLPPRRRQRVLLPEYAKLLVEPQRGDVLKDLEAIREDR